MCAVAVTRCGYAHRISCVAELIGFRSYAGVEGDGRRPMSGPAGTGSGGRRPASRIGFRTRSEVDVLDDGFKWRKYGKKAVKSSPNPRYDTIQH